MATIKECTDALIKALRNSNIPVKDVKTQLTNIINAMDDTQNICLKHLGYNHREPSLNRHRILNTAIESHGNGAVLRALNTLRKKHQDAIDTIKHDINMVLSKDTPRARPRPVVAIAKVKPISLREFGYNFSSDPIQRHNTLMDAVDTVGGDKVIERLTYLADIWRNSTVRNAQNYAKNADDDLKFVRSLAFGEADDDGYEGSV